MKHAKLKRRFLAALRSRKGSGVFAGAFVFLALLIVVAGVVEFLRLNTCTAQISDAMESSIISVCADNYSQTYNGLREGYSGGYALGDLSWAESVSEGDVYAYLDLRLGTRADGSGRARYVDGALLYRISNLRITIENAPLAPGGGAAEQFVGTATFTLTMPLSGAWKALPPMTGSKTVTAGFSTKF